MRLNIFFSCFSDTREVTDAREPRVGILDFEEEAPGPEPAVLPVRAVRASVPGLDQGGGRHLPQHAHQSGRQPGGDGETSQGAQQLQGRKSFELGRGGIIPLPRLRALSRPILHTFALPLLFVVARWIGGFLPPLIGAAGEEMETGLVYYITHLRIAVLGFSGFFF